MRGWRIVSFPFGVEESLEAKIVGATEEERIGKDDAIEIVHVLRSVGGEVEGGGFRGMVACF